MKFTLEDLEQLGRRVADTLTEAADTVGKKTEEVIEVQKIRSQISMLRRENEKAFQDMGRILYTKYQDGESVDPSCAALCEEIEKHMEAIEEYEKKLVELRGKGFCKECQTPLSKGMAYCPTCGAKVENEEEPAEEDIFESESIFEEEIEEKAEETVVFPEEMEEQHEPAKEVEEDLEDLVDSLEGKEGEV